MGQELLEVRGYIKTPRKYFVATNSKGYRAIRGSADRDYEWCIIAKELSPWGYVYSSWSATERNANKYCTTWNNRHDDSEMYEVVKCEQVTAKEARVIKKEIAMQHTSLQVAVETIKQIVQEAQGVSEGKEMESENDNN
ncbi:hypothetical protein UFOVP964_97 [uncultured Caudovirales phage]|uniref:Uncharacterized protein n=1 Tax=uncultured Caudovirales phage TaxID=2100421 RepID=A0A6J5PCP7_9CAUD|nr:hypothetical protein UFOVP854_97 [uncultured Caudovirales phage]CAB4174898.1 hypothetical protein UFOVP964_97 [uncultured Caudovirales phage]CAB4179300.1 hypothetical protein UFOVP1034_61 [uncultured Caudovirales phage]CAB4189105.1 hypothetical protein UFOVP1177_61 [uncultured Caudovirales phage]CAB4193260.1 hypothetical protein UFOVP1243_48 [uncultured Caudovirales phage]